MRSAPFSSSAIEVFHDHRQSHFQVVFDLCRFSHPRDPGANSAARHAVSFITGLQEVNRFPQRDIMAAKIYGINLNRESRFSTYVCKSQVFPRIRALGLRIVFDKLVIPLHHDGWAALLFELLKTSLRIERTLHLLGVELPRYGEKTDSDQKC